VTTTAWIVDLADVPLTAAVSRLRGLLASAQRPDLGDDLQRADVVFVWTDRALTSNEASALTTAGRRLVLVGPSLDALSRHPTGQALVDSTGLLLAGRTPLHDIRIRAGRDATNGLRPTGHSHAHADHIGQHEHARDTVLLIDKVVDDVQVLRTAKVGLAEHPVLTWRPMTGVAVWTLGTTSSAVATSETARMFAALLDLMTGTPEPEPVRVGLLGYGAIGHEHSRAIRAVHGLELTAVCDVSADRLAAAEHAVPGIATTHSAEALLNRDDVDLVIVSTPPDTHADWALRAIAAGKHVVVEKPFAIRTSEADQVLTAAASAGRLAVVYQNRRYDPDFLAIRRLLDQRAIGDVFHIETFVGGYGHPCNLWHSDESVSGGVFYDWGSHLIDQILQLIPTPIASVTAAALKLRWFDVTNADHSRTTIRFVDGVEAEFVHSDIAAVLKPRWYILGTEGSIVGHWRTEKTVGRNDIGTLVEDILAPTDSSPRIELHAMDGSITQVATPDATPYGFHRELADMLRYGLPMSVTGEQSRRVLAVMEAASESAANEGRPEVLR